VRFAGLTLAGALVATGPAAAQIPDLPGIAEGWESLSYPKLFWGPTDGLTVGWYVAQIRDFGYDDWGRRPEPYAGSIAVDGQLSTSGSRQLGLELRLPAMLDGWRFQVALQAERRARENYFGIGNDAVNEPDSVTDDRPHFFRADHRRLFVRGQVERRIVGPLRILGGFHIEGWRVDTLSTASMLARDLAAGVDPAITENTLDAAWRVGVVLDLRDDEVAPHRGALFQAIHGAADADVLGDVSYTRTTLSAAGYVPIGRRVTVAARVLGQRMGGSPPLGSVYLIEGSDRPAAGLGGAGSHRGLLDRRLLGPDKLLTNLDLRIDLFGIQNAARFTWFGFVDTGRVFGQGDLELTTDDMKVGAGMGLVVQIGRAGILGGSWGTGPDGLVSQFHSQWTF
jgi:hypothetical protein